MAEPSRTSVKFDGNELQTLVGAMRGSEPVKEPLSLLQGYTANRRTNGSLLLDHIAWSYSQGKTSSYLPLVTAESSKLFKEKKAE